MVMGGQLHGGERNGSPPQILIERSLEVRQVAVFKNASFVGNNSRQPQTNFAGSRGVITNLCIKELAFCADLLRFQINTNVITPQNKIC